VKLRFRRILGLHVGHQRCDLIIHGSRRVCQSAPGNRSKILRHGTVSVQTRRDQLPCVPIVHSRARLNLPPQK
jgi:hypothetical protein